MISLIHNVPERLALAAAAMAVVGAEQSHGPNRRCFKNYHSVSAPVRFLPTSAAVAPILSLSMADWGPVFVAVVLFVLLSPGLLFQIPGKGRIVEFGTMQTSGVAIFVHSIIFFALAAIFILAVHVHVYTG
ncbi:hypothetical protein ZIOFF_041289 [Zingiber officinale]|uniref:Uncharacterized protein n=2 Tax=Zingiber officinale TaxID=94328 RepID=A0A8J5GDL8_ZINOF|nr:hypothetical protein ZIOFF_041289 [Zingiber officinale]